MLWHVNACCFAAGEHGIGGCRQSQRHQHITHFASSLYLSLCRLVGRLDDGLEPYLPPHKRAYAFSSLAPAAARMAVWLLPDIPALVRLAAGWCAWG